MVRKFHKYKAQRANGFPSKLESVVNDLLVLMERAGEIRVLKRQQTVHLPAGINWRVDFSYIDPKTEELCYVEAKGVATGEYRLKLKLYKHFIENKLTIYGGDYRKPKIIEIVNG